MKTCPRCGFLNRPDWNFCQACSTSLSPPGTHGWTPLPAAPPVSKPFPRWAKTAIGSAIVVVLAAFVGGTLTNQRRAAEHRTEVASRVNAFESEAHAAIASGDLAAAQAKLGEAIALVGANVGAVEPGRLTRLNALKAECADASSADALDAVIVGLSEKDLRAYQQTGELAGQKTFTDPGVASYYAGQVAAKRERAGAIRQEAARRRQEEERLLAAARKEADAAAKQRAAAEMPKFDDDTSREILLRFTIKPVLRQMLNDPDSLQDLTLASIRPVPKNPGAFSAVVTYRARNGFGALVFERQEFIVVRGTGSSFGDAWHAVPVTD